jgi:hypothetical protein
LVSRIPAQAGQSYKAASTVAYLHDNENSIYVSHWQIFLDGADFDIDKAYQMSYSFKNGLFVGWSPYFNLSSQEIGESFKLPAPNNVLYKKVEEAQGKEGENIIDLDQNKDFNIPAKTPMGTYKIVKLLEYVNQKTIKDSGVQNFIKTSNQDLFRIIKTHNKYFNEEGLNNFKVHNMLETSRSAKHYISSYSPITFGGYRDLKKEKDYTLNIYNPASSYLQQENNYVGKGVIGIAATGIKTYFTLVSYYSNKVASGKLTAEDAAFFSRIYKVNNTTKLVQHPSGLNLTKKGKEIFKTALSNSLVRQYQKKTQTGTEYFSNEEIANFVNSLDSIDDPSIKLSSLLSAATDNAKELILADINAGVDFAGMHIFLIIMGFNEIDVAKYMTSDLVLSIKEHISDSFLYPKSRYGADNRILNLKPEDISKDVVSLPKKEIISDVLQNSYVSKMFSIKDSANKVKLSNIVNNSKDLEEFLTSATEVIEK